MKKRFRVIAFGLAILSVLIIAAACESPVDPPKPKPKPAEPAPDIQSVAFGAGRYVAVGTKGAIFSSSDGLTWSRKDSGTTRNLWSVTYGKNQFVAVGDGGVIRTSTNGETWNGSNYRYNAFLRSLIYVAGKFVAVGGGGVIVTSADGAEWAVPRSPQSGQMHLRSVVEGGGKILAVGHGETIITSSDLGINWTRTNQKMAAKNGKDILWDAIHVAGQFIAVGENGVVLTSTNGTAWTKSTPGPVSQNPESPDFGKKIRLYGIAHNGSSGAGGKYVVTGNEGTVITSSNGTSLTTISDIRPYLRDVTYAAGKFVAVGSRILYSADGSRWIERAPVGIKGLLAVIHAGGRFVAVGRKGSIVSSPDGVNWTKGTLK